MDAVFQPLASATGASLDQIKLIVCLFISYPLGSVFIRLPKEQYALKHLFNIGIALFYLVAVLQLYSGTLQLLGSTLATYFIARTVQSPNMPWIVFVIVMGHLMINHVIRAVYGLSYETVEITGPQMVLTMKLTTFAFNVLDGRRPETDLDKWQTQKRVSGSTYPSLLAFLGYACYFPGVLVGPYLDYASYDGLIKGTLFTATRPIDSAQKAAPTSESKRAVPDGRKRVALQRMASGVFFLGIFVVLGGKCHFGLALEPWFKRKPFWWRFWFHQLAGIVERSKYYALWKLTEGASIFTGLGFTGWDARGNTLWDGAANVHIRLIELAPNFKLLLDNWNINTNIWLRECVYKRVTVKGQKPGNTSQMITFATSAFWHGIAAGYYLTFIMGGFITAAARLCRQYFRPLVLSPLPAPQITVTSPTASSAPKTARAPEPPATALKTVYDVVGTFCAVTLMNYVATPFMLLDISSSVRAWHALRWYGHVMVFGTIAYFYAGGKKQMKGFQTARVKKAEDAWQTASTGSVNSPLVVPPVHAALERTEKKLQ